MRGASEYSSYFVALAVGAGVVQFFAVRERKREREEKIFYLLIFP